MITPLDRLNTAIKDHYIDTRVVQDVPHVFRHEEYKITIQPTEEMTTIEVRCGKHGHTYMDGRWVTAEDRQGRTYACELANGVATLMLPDEIYFFAVVLHAAQTDTLGDRLYRQGHGPLA